MRCSSTGTGCSALLCEFEAQHGCMQRAARKLLDLYTGYEFNLVLGAAVLLALLSLTT